MLFGSVVVLVEAVLLLVVLSVFLTDVFPPVWMVCMVLPSVYLVLSQRCFVLIAWFVRSACLFV